MASIVSKLARAAFTTHATPSAVAAGGRRTAAIRVSHPGGPKSEEIEKARPKSGFNPHRSILHAEPYLQHDENVFKSKEAMWAFYEDWCKYHGILRGRREMERLFKTFSATARRVYEFNNSGVHGKMCMGRFSDMTKQEKFRVLHPRPVLSSHDRLKRSGSALLGTCT